MEDNTKDAADDHRSESDRLFIAAFVASAFLTSFVAKAVGVSHIMGVVPLGGLVGALLAEWLWRARRKA